MVKFWITKLFQTWNHRFQHFAIPTVTMCNPQRLWPTFKPSVTFSQFQPGIDSHVFRNKAEAVSVLISWGHKWRYRSTDFEFGSRGRLDCGWGRSIHPSMALQPLLGPDLLQKTSPLFSVFFRLLHPRISRICGVSLQMMSASLVFILSARMTVLHFWTVVGRSMYQKSNPFSYSQTVCCLSVLSEESLRFSQHQLFCWMQFSPTSNPQPGGPEYPFSSGSSLSTCPAWEAIPITTLLPVYLSGFFDHRSPTTTSK